MPDDYDIRFPYPWRCVRCGIVVAKKHAVCHDCRAADPWYLDATGIPRLGGQRRRTTPRPHTQHHND